MAEEGDTITYTYSDGTVVSEDVSNVGEVAVDYCDGAGGSSADSSGGAGGRVENATIDVSNESTLYIWVAASNDGGDGNGRYRGGQISGGAFNAATTEISLFNTDASDSSDEPFLVGAGGGGSGYDSEAFLDDNAGGGARGGTGLDDAEGVAPPAGGDAAPDESTVGEDGDGAIDDQDRGLVSGGTTTKGGGSPADTDAEIQLTFQAGQDPPEPPENLTAELL